MVDNKEVSVWYKLAAGCLCLLAQQELVLGFTTTPTVTITREKNKIWLAKPTPSLLLSTKDDYHDDGSEDEAVQQVLNGATTRSTIRNQEPNTSFQSVQSRGMREPDTPDRAISIVSELKANAALFAAFAYGGLSIPSTLTVSESKVTSVTTSLSTIRPLPGNDLIQAFVVLDSVTLCLMISCVAASQLLIYQLTDGSWYELEENRQYDELPASASSAMGRLVTDYRLEFAIARTTFDMGLVALLLAVAVRGIAIFDISISLPISILLGGTCLLLGAAYLQSYLGVFRRLEQQLSQTQQLKRHTTRTSDGTILLAAPPIFLVAVAAVIYFNPYNNGGTSSSSSLAGSVTPTTTTTTPTTTTTAPAAATETTTTDRGGFAARLASYSSAAGEAKLKLAVDKVAEERAAAVAAKDSAGSSSNKKKSSVKRKERASTSSKTKSSSNNNNKEGKDNRKSTAKKSSTPAETTTTTTTTTIINDEVVDKSKKKEKTVNTDDDADKTKRKDKTTSSGDTQPVCSESSRDETTGSCLPEKESTEEYASKTTSQVEVN